MGTAKFDDGLPSNPKFIRAGAVASWLWVCGVLYCRRGLTDGLIPRVVVPSLVVGLKSPYAHAKRLVEVGLWDVEADDYRVHDFLDWNPSKAQIEGYRAQDRERKQARHSDRNLNGIHADSKRIPVEKAVTRGTHARAESESVSESESGFGLNGEESARETPQALMDLWNELTLRPLPSCRELTPNRERRALQRLRDRSLADWREIIAKIQASDFCRGMTGGTWVASFDWLLQPDTAVKVLEGKYDNRTAVVPRASGHETAAAHTLRESRELLAALGTETPATVRVRGHLE